MSGLKFTLSDVTSFLPDDLSGLEIIIIQVWGNHMSLAKWTDVYIYIYICMYIYIYIVWTVEQGDF